MIYALILCVFLAGVILIIRSLKEMLSQPTHTDECLKQTNYIGMHEWDEHDSREFQAPYER